MSTTTLDQAKAELNKRGFLNLDTPGVDYVAEINRLKEEKNAVILAHYYQESAIQDIADFVGDSLQLAQEAAKTDADIIVFAGVHFMAETAKILNPGKTVVLPDLHAGCSLADSCPPADFKAFKEAHPDHIVVTYINCSADIKALSDIVCTSSNALKIIQSIPEDQPIIFAPDKNLGTYTIITAYVETDHGSIEILYDEGYRGETALDDSVKFLTENLGLSSLILRFTISLKNKT